MLNEQLRKEFPELMHKLASMGQHDVAGIPGMNDIDYCELSLAIHHLASRLAPDLPAPVSRVAEAYHLKGELREAGKHYKKVLEMDSPQQLSPEERNHVMRFAPVLHTTPNECFELMDVVAIHHPEKPLIAYHLFWEDDYNFPDDFEPCDHEQVWVAYDPLSGQVIQVWAFFHSRVITTREAAEDANRNNGQANVYVQWGTHGSLLQGWEKLRDEHNDSRTIMEVMKQSYLKVSKGGRLPDHPLKRWWPKGFAGEFADYLDFSRALPTSERLRQQDKMVKSRWSNAVLQQLFLLYNFHPKFDWPDSYEFQQTEEE